MADYFLEDGATRQEIADYKNGLQPGERDNFPINRKPKDPDTRNKELGPDGTIIDTSKPRPVARRTDDLGKPLGTEIEASPESTVGVDGKKRAPNGEVVIEGDKSKTNYGVYTRTITTDPKTGKKTESWTNTERKSRVEQPASERFMQALNQNAVAHDQYGNPIIQKQKNGDMVANQWDAALKEQKGAEQTRLYDTINSLNQRNEEAKERKRKGTDAYNLAVSKSFATAIAQLRENMKTAQDRLKPVEGAAPAVMEEGDGLNGTIYESKDGRLYIRGIVSKEALDVGSREAAEAGSKDLLTKVMVSQEVDRFGNPKEGVGPTFSMVGIKNGVLSNKGDGEYFKNFNTAQAIKTVRDSLTRSGWDEELANNYLRDAFNGLYDDFEPHRFKDARNAAKNKNHESDARTRETNARAQAIEEGRAGVGGRTTVSGLLSQEKKELEQLRQGQISARTLVVVRAKVLAGIDSVLNPKEYAEANRQLEEAISMLKTGAVKTEKPAHEPVKPAAGDPVKPAGGGNGGADATAEEFDPNKRYRVGDRFVRKGKTYTVGADGQPHIVK